jgi:hypothetical protein
MKHKEKPDGKKQRRSAEQVTPEEALTRMKSFSERKEKFVAAVQKSKN